MALNPLNDLITFSLKEMTSLYTDFARVDNTTRQVFYYLSNKNLNYVNSIVKDPLKKIHSSITKAVLDDIKRVFKRSKFIGLIFSIVLVILCLLMMFQIHFFFIVKVEKKIDVILYMKKIMDSMIETTGKYRSVKIREETEFDKEKDMYII